jgi:ribonuclease HII
VETIVKGDGKSLSIAAASVIAKVTRDRFMMELAQTFPGYGWEKNVGYPTKVHREAIKTLGLTPHHRRSFGLVREQLAGPQAEQAELPL